jgi:hypothetical protein
VHHLNVCFFFGVMERGRAKNRISVRRMQMKLLEAGNATTGVWLGKQLLGQADVVSAHMHVQICVVAGDAIGAVAAVKIGDAP